MIFDGTIQPGELLPPRRQPVEQFGLGISTINDAVQSLSGVGLVESGSGNMIDFPQLA
jgi:GntR family transcriptional repressor for pyruvate dehydrogenase complex